MLGVVQIKMCPIAIDLMKPCLRVRDADSFRLLAFLGAGQPGPGVAYANDEQAILDLRVDLNVTGRLLRIQAVSDGVLDHWLQDEGWNEDVTTLR